MNKRQGSGKANVDIAAKFEALNKQREARRIFATACMEKAAIKVKELRVAGMINKTGADEITHQIILAMSALEEDSNEALPIDVIK